LQNETSKRGGRRYMPYAFTEQGIAMLSGLLNSDIAIDTNIVVMRAFVMLRQYVLKVLLIKYIFIIFASKKEYELFKM
jgi:hypothetical protein